MDITNLVNLCSRSWSLKALSLISDGHAARISPLAAAARCSRTAMRASLNHLLELGMLERNPGHGHPLRPEYRLTEAGKQIAIWSDQLETILPRPEDKTLLRTKWSLPIISCVPTETRFSVIRKRLLPVTDRALSQNLKRLADQKWVTRKVRVQVSPPLVLYDCETTGRKVFDHIEKLPNF